MGTPVSHSKQPSTPRRESCPQKATHQLRTHTATLRNSNNPRFDCNLNPLLPQGLQILDFHTEQWSFKIAQPIYSNRNPPISDTHSS
ncbi:unnamed protein product [Paramecium octaurelia]|uniref:Uncharacterized protein n=1 Tax=Paramecium octaurelia TaxID=43137 RepID=A0A8S1XGR0_PAROT|nr:unnamed protein product [Paramecium octaurelia]